MSDTTIPAAPVATANPAGPESTKSLPAQRKAAGHRVPVQPAGIEARAPGTQKPPVAALPVAPPAVAPATATAPPASATAALPPPVRVLFEDGKTDLSPDDAAAIRGLAHAMPAPNADSVTVLAYAAGKPDDPSTARRLSLSRGLAVRSVLMESGVPSSQIYVRALGAAAHGGPADRVELTVAPIGTVTR